MSKIRLQLLNTAAFVMIFEILTCNQLVISLNLKVNEPWKAVNKCEHCLAQALLFEVILN